MLHSYGFTGKKDSEENINKILMKMMALLLKKRKVTYDRGSNRMLVLRRCVPKDTFLKICEILHKVHDIRLTYTGVCCNGLCPKYPLETLNGNEKIPKAVKRIFHIELIVAVEKAPINLLRNLPWDMLLIKATEDVDEYIEWKIRQEREREKKI